MEDYQLRIAKPQDLSAIVKIFNQAVFAGNINDETNPVSATDRQSWFTQFNSHFPLWVLLDQQEQIVGWVSLEPFYAHPAYSHSAEISIYLDQQHQGMCLGQQMLNFVDQQISRSLSIKTVIAYIYERNHASQRLFSKCGYQHCGSLPKISYLNKEFRSLEIYCKHF